MGQFGMASSISSINRSLWPPPTRRPSPVITACLEWWPPEMPHKCKGMAITSATRSILDAAEKGADPEQVELAVARAIERGPATAGVFRTALEQRLLTLARQTGVPLSGRLRSALRATFDARGTHPLPATLPPPPAGWGLAYRKLAAEAGLEPFDLLIGRQTQCAPGGIR